jgi:hypothetical protein
MLAPIFACLMGCGQQVTVIVDAKAAPDAPAAGHFTILAGDPNVKPRNPDFIALGRDVARALTARGFQEAAGPDAADLAVVIDWTTGDPKKYYRHIGGDAGGPQVRGAAAGTKGMPAGGTNNPASFGMGMDATDGIELDYPQTFTLKAVTPAALKADPKAPALWEMTLTSETTIAEPAKIGPPMIAAAMPYMAKTAARTKVHLGMAEPPVKYVRGEIAALPTATASK